VASTRDRIIDTSAELFRRQGFTGTGVKQIVTEADAPFGSLYHFFPGGKEELGATVVRWSGDLYRVLVESVWDERTDVVRGARHVFTVAAAHLRDSDYADACPIATVALEVSSTSEPMRVACAEVFESWIVAATDRLVGAGVARRRARPLAIALLSLLEGAFIFCRAARDTEALDAAGAAATALVRDAVATARRRG